MNVQETFCKVDDFNIVNKQGFIINIYAPYVYKKLVEFFELYFTPIIIFT